MSLETKYYCNMCDYMCEYNSHWLQHLNCNKHKNNGKRLPRCDKSFDTKCKNCVYETNNLVSMRLHYLTKHSNKEDRKKEFKYYCASCDSGTFSDVLFNRHNETKKHILKQFKVTLSY